MTALDNGKGIRRTGILNMLQIGHNTVCCGSAICSTSTSPPQHLRPVYRARGSAAA